MKLCGRAVIPAAHGDGLMREHIYWRKAVVGKSPNVLIIEKVMKNRSVPMRVPTPLDIIKRPGGDRSHRKFDRLHREIRGGDI